MKVEMQTLRFKWNCQVGNC